MDAHSCEYNNTWNFNTTNAKHENERGRKIQPENLSRLPTDISAEKRDDYCFSGYCRNGACQHVKHPTRHPIANTEISLTITDTL